MVYGPIAALLVELFPTRIRYTSMSLPYHIGNGWFGGFLPLIAASIVASTAQAQQASAPAPAKTCINQYADAQGITPAQLVRTGFEIKAALPGVDVTVD